MLLHYYYPNWRDDVTEVYNISVSGRRYIQCDVMASIEAGLFRYEPVIILTNCLREVGLGEAPYDRKSQVKGEEDDAQRANYVRWAIVH